jgi:hypothetical protein
MILTSSSSAARRRNAPQLSSISSVKAFLRSRRSSVTVATPSATRYPTGIAASI